MANVTNTTLAVTTITPSPSPMTSHITSTPLQTVLSTTANTTNYFNPEAMSEAWDTNKYTLAWLIPVIIVVVILLGMASLGLFYTIRGVELWILKCCYKNCGCCPPPSRRLDSEYTHLTDALHDNDGITLTEFDRGDRDLASRGIRNDKMD